MLEAPGDADDGDAEDEAEKKMADGDFPPATENPDEIHHRGEAARLARTIDEFVAEGPHRVGTQLEQLDAERDADDGDAHQQPHQEVKQRDEQTAEYEPEKVSNRFHIVRLTVPRKGRKNDHDF